MLFYVVYVFYYNYLTGSKFEQEFKMGILIRGANGDTQGLEESSTNPTLSTDMHNRTRRLKCTGVNLFGTALFPSTGYCVSVSLQAASHLAY